MTLQFYAWLLAHTGSSINPNNFALMSLQGHQIYHGFDVVMKKLFMDAKHSNTVYTKLYKVASWGK